MKRMIEIDIDPSPEEMAELLAAMSDVDQAIFFNNLAEHVSKWSVPACFQWSQVDSNLTKEARIMLSNLVYSLG